LQGLQGFLPAQGLQGFLPAHGLQGFALPAQGLQGLQGFFPAHGLHGLQGFALPAQGLQGLQGLHGLAPPIAIVEPVKSTLILIVLSNLRTIIWGTLIL
jgi:hypothetical protein